LAPWLFFSFMFIGAVVYLVGTVRWSGSAAQRLRMVGALLVSLSVGVPTTLTLSFPAALLLFSTAFRRDWSSSSKLSSPRTAGRAGA
jgi:hypothetical protein